MKHRVNYVYWLHLSTHVNIDTEGYIGVSHLPSKRFYQHKRTGELKKSSSLHKALNIHKDNVYLSVLCSGDRDYCLDIEKKLRPNKNIAWNTLIGGGEDPFDCTGLTHSDEVKEKISKGNVGKTRDTPSIFKGVTNRFTKEQMQQMVMSRKATDGYKHSEATKVKLRQANKGSKSQQAVSIEVTLEGQKPRVFGAITEAVEELSLSHSAVKARLKDDRNHMLKGYSVRYV